MKAYSEYKNSEIEWVKQIPSDWGICKLKFTALGKGQCFIDGDWIESKDISTDGIRYLTSGNVGPLKYKEQGNGYITEDTFRKLECRDVYEGDILISRLNEPISRACIVPNLNSRIVTCVDNVIYRPDCNRFNKKYIVYVLNCTPYTEKANLSARGVTMHRVSRTMLGNFYIPVPSIAEQQVIASFLDAKTKPIDDIIAKREKQIELLEEMKSAIISHAVSKGFNLEAKMKDSGIEWIGEVPEHWEVADLKRYAKISTGKTPSTKKDEYFENEEIVWFTPGDFPDGSIILNDSSRKIDKRAIKASEAFLYPKNSVFLVGIGGTLGKIGIFEEEASCNQQVNVIVCKSDIIKSYVAYYLYSKKEILKVYSNAATLPILNQDKTGYIKIALPPLSEQQAIASYLDSETSKIDTRIAKRRKQIELLQEYKQALITAAVTGKIDVREYNS